MALFEKSAELTVTLFFALRKSLCLSVASAKGVKKKATCFAFFSRRYTKRKVPEGTFFWIKFLITVMRSIGAAVFSE